MKERIKKIIRTRLNFGDVEIKDDISLRENLGIDSIDFLELVIGLEQEFNIKIEDTEIKKENFETIDKIAEFIGGKLNG